MSVREGGREGGNFWFIEVLTHLNTKISNLDFSLWFLSVLLNGRFFPAITFFAAICVFSDFAITFIFYSVSFFIL